jgi:prepilin-type N-terminal cleavage/methylation domain-containing protein
MTARTAAARIAREEGGFTLVELLVAMAAGIIVCGALFALQNVAMFETNRVFARVDATQRARQVVETIESELHSSCIADGVTPIQSGSTSTSLRFISKYGSAATLTPELHVITLSGTSLIDTRYAKSGGTSPNWTFSTTPLVAPTNPKTLITGVSADGTTPVFRYYPYGIARDSAGNAYLDSAGNPYVTLLDGTSTLPSGVTTSSGGAVPAGTTPANSPTALSTAGAGLTATDAKTASAVRFTLKVNPGGAMGTNPNYHEETVFSDSVVLRLTPPLSDRNPQAVAPCA